MKMLGLRIDCQTFTLKHILIKAEKEEKKVAVADEDKFQKN